MHLILASTSPYRRQLLAQLQLDFTCVAPNATETPLAGESPSGMVERLARHKALSVANLYPEALVIGSDQVAVIDDCILGKPGNFEAAALQLKRASGREVQFFTAIALLSISQQFERFHVEPFRVQFRSLSDQQIAHYLRRDEPYDCAGSFKIESLGIALFEQLMGNDPTSLQGLPLIKSVELLALAGIDVLGT